MNSDAYDRFKSLNIVLPAWRGLMITNASKEKLIISLLSRNCIHFKGQNVCTTYEVMFFILKYSLQNYKKSLMTSLRKINCITFTSFHWINVFSFMERRSFQDWSWRNVLYSVEICLNHLDIRLTINNNNKMVCLNQENEHLLFNIIWKILMHNVKTSNRFYISKIYFR